MAEHWRLKELKIKGFRGFIGLKTFSISEPFAIFCGPQRSGKSSTLVAIEWGIFGDEIAKKVFIEERKDWKIRNENSSVACVEIVLQKQNNTLKIVRSDKTYSGEQNFYFELNNTRDTDEGKLRTILGIQPKDYFSSVHLHQEIIRDIIVETPQTRRDSIDRLLGLSELRNIIDGIKSANISRSLKNVDNKFNQIEVQLNAVITNKEKEIREEKEAGTQRGLTPDDLSEIGAKKKFESIKDKIIDFAKKAGLTVPDIPLALGVSEMQFIVPTITQLLRNLRNELPSLKRQSELLSKQSSLQKMQEDFIDFLGSIKKLKGGRRDIVEGEGDSKKIQRRIKELNSKLNNAKIKRNGISKQGSTIDEAIKYFDEILKTGKKKLPCPVCEKPIDDVAQLQVHLKEIKKELGKDLELVCKDIEEYEKKIPSLENLIEKLDQLGQDIKDSSGQLNKCKLNIETVLGYEIKDTEDPIIVVKNELREIEDELKKINDAVKESNKKLNTIEDQIFDLSQILRVLKLEADIEDLLKIKETEEYEKVENSKEKLEKFAAYVDIIRQKIDKKIQEDAMVKLGEARDSIANIFRKLADRPDYPEIEIDPDSYKIMAVKGNERISALSIFNHGDLNCAGLSIFLGLGTSQRVTHDIGFIILDDPSQSLDDFHKENLINILNSVPDDKQVLISTSESGFRELILNKIIKKKKHYDFDPWSDTKGVQPKEII